MVRKIIVALFGLVGWLTFSAQAEMKDLGPAVGSKIPHNLSAYDHTGAVRNFENLVGKKGTVLAFVRSADWCPYCKKQLIDLQENAAAAVAERGYELVGISYDSVEKLAHFAERRDINYPLLSDAGSEIIMAFGILNEKYKPGDRVYGIPHPIIVITDEKGEVQAKFFEESYKDRPQVEVIISALDAIAE